MKILLIEDEPKTGSYLQKGLSEAGFTVDLVRDGIDGLHLALTENPDMVVLDVMLPSMDGWQVLKQIRVAKRASGHAADRQRRGGRQSQRARTWGRRLPH